MSVSYYIILCYNIKLEAKLAEQDTIVRCSVASATIYPVYCVYNILLYFIVMFFSF